MKSISLNLLGIEEVRPYLKMLLLVTCLTYMTIYSAHAQLEVTIEILIEFTPGGNDPVQIGPNPFFSHLQIPTKLA